MTLPPGTILFAAPDDDLALVQAKEYISMHGLTMEDVKIGRTKSGMLLVETKKGVMLGPI